VTNRIKVEQGGRESREANRRRSPRPGPRPRKKLTQTVVSNLPDVLPSLPEELAIWRAFLADEIDAILWEDRTSPGD